MRTEPTEVTIFLHAGLFAAACMVSALIAFAIRPPEPEAPVQAKRPVHVASALRLQILPLPKPAPTSDRERSSSIAGH